MHNPPVSHEIKFMEHDWKIFNETKYHRVENIRAHHTLWSKSHSIFVSHVWVYIYLYAGFIEDLSQHQNIGKSLLWGTIVFKVYFTSMVPNSSVVNNIIKLLKPNRASLVAQMVKNLPAMQDTQVEYLGWEDPLEKGMATYSSILAWRILWTEDPGGLQSMGSQIVGENWVANTFTSGLS